MTGVRWLPSQGPLDHIEHISKTGFLDMLAMASSDQLHNNDTTTTIYKRYKTRLLGAATVKGQHGMYGSAYMSTYRMLAAK